VTTTSTTTRRQAGTLICAEDPACKSEQV